MAYCTLSMYALTREMFQDKGNFKKFCCKQNITYLYYTNERKIFDFTIKDVRNKFFKLSIN